MNLIINAIKNLIHDEESTNALQKIIGPGQEIMVYGLTSCYWQEIRDDCMRQNYIVYDYDTYPYSTLPFDGDCLARSCKAKLTSLILENVKRVTQGKPIIPLIFLVASDEKKLSLNKIASTHGCELGNITDEEIRRLCKIRLECAPAIQHIVDLTVKFIKVTPKITFGFTFYVLEQIPPFWDAPEFNKLWRHRKHRHRTEKQFPWKEILTQQTQAIFSQQSKNFSLFNTVQKNIQNDERVDSKNVSPDKTSRLS